MDPEQAGFELEGELEWLGRVVERRLAVHFGQEGAVWALEPPPQHAATSAMGGFLGAHDLGDEERLALILALAPRLRPSMLDVFFASNPNLERGFTEFGGILGKNHGGFLPTRETLLFILGGSSLSRRLELGQLFETEHRLQAAGWLVHAPEHPFGEPMESAALIPSRDLLDRILSVSRGAVADELSGLPAQRLRTALAWDDLVLPARTIQELNEIRLWASHSSQIMDDWGLSRFLKPGFRALFHGPPGTGKTLAASLLGREVDRDVYRIDLSMIVSKYIGETEKNLGRVFDLAEKMGWLLFFDEADALFAKRSTSLSSSNDRYANLQVSYLLQRIEEFQGIALLASNLKDNIDEAFMRRLQVVVHFEAPNVESRLRLWLQGRTEGLQFDANLDLESLAERYPLTGGQIVNVIRHAALYAAARGDATLATEDLERGIQREMEKEGKLA